ncbi:unnamed protein product [Rotaria sordida]|nr:unnamed protein product [Rotaria sordida]CAF1136081.1 unnamed protein product [Rotaria sordida]
MRLTPVPLFFYRHPVHAVKYSGFSGVITHGDQKAYDACRYYGALIVAALQGATKEELLNDEFYETHISWFAEGPLAPEIMRIANGSYKQNDGYDAGIRGKGYIVNALEAALWAFWSEKTFKKGALAAVNLGDDTDTTAAIYGQLAGAYYGYEKLPKKWVEKVYAKRFLQGLSMWIAYEGQMWYENKALLFNPSLATVAPKQKVVAISSNEQELNPEKLPSIQLTSLEETRRVGLSNRSEKDTSSVMSNFCAIL